MTTRERRALQRRVLRLVNRYRQQLGLAHWRITVLFGPLEDTAPPVGQYETPSAGCEADHRYRVATLQFNLDRYTGADARHLDLDVIHELMHCHTARQRALIDYLWDWVVEEAEEGAAVDLEQVRTSLTRARRPR